MPTTSSPAPTSSVSASSSSSRAGPASSSSQTKSNTPSSSSSASSPGDKKDSPTSGLPPTNRPSANPAPSAKPDNNDDARKSALTKDRAASMPSANQVSPSSSPANQAPQLAVASFNAPQQQPTPAPNTTPAPASSSPYSSISSHTVQSCRKSTDCPSKICISGFCATSSGFVLSTSTFSNGTVVTQSAPFLGAGKKGHGVSPTACSDPRCTLPADLAGMNGLDADAYSAPQDTHLLSDAALAGIVLSLLLLFLFLLLAVPKVRDLIKAKVENWRNRKDEAKRKELGDGSPEFGNEDASIFEKRERYASSFVSGSPILLKEGGEMHQVVYMGQPQQQHEQPSSFTGVGARRKAISFAADLPPSQRAHMANTYPAVPQQARQPRETVLPYTVGTEEDKEALMGLRGIASPMPSTDNQSPFEPVTPTMPSSAAFGSHPASPNTPGSAYSARTALLPASLQTGRQPVVQAVRPNMRMPLGGGNGSRPPIRPTMQRLPSVKITPSSMISEMEWVSGQSPKR